MKGLNFFRCHGVDCAGNHPVKSFTSQSEERKKSWKRCDCPIVANGSLNRVSRRKATKETDWDRAREKMAPYVEADSWDIDPDPPPAPRLPVEPPPADDSFQPPAKGTKGVSMTIAVQSYLWAHRKAKSAESTIRGHRYSTNRILRFATRMKITAIDQWNSDLVSLLQSESEVAGDTARTQMNRLKAFFNWCLGRKWITEHPGKLPVEIKNRETRTVGHKQRNPYLNTDLAHMYKACETYGDDVVSYTRVWTGADLADFIAVSTFTGLRISDVSNFHIDRLRGKDEVHVRTTKAGAMVYTAVPGWLADRIRWRARTIGPYIFGEHRSTIISVTTNEWRKRLKALWKMCPPFAEKPTHHRFRHTFARVLLEDFVPPTVVADLMGNTEKVVREYYAAWVPERQEKTSTLLRQAFRDVPTPLGMPQLKVVEIKKLG